MKLITTRRQQRIDRWLERLPDKVMGDHYCGPYKCATFVFLWLSVPFYVWRIGLWLWIVPRLELRYRWRRWVRRFQGGA